MVIRIGGPPPEGFERETVEEEPQFCHFCFEEVKRVTFWKHFREKGHDFECREFIIKLKEGIIKRLKNWESKNLDNEIIVSVILEELYNLIQSNPNIYDFILNNFDEEFLLRNFLKIELIHKNSETEEFHHLYLYYNFNFDEYGNIIDISLLLDDGKGNRFNYSGDIGNLNFYCPDCKEIKEYELPSEQRMSIISSYLVERYLEEKYRESTQEDFKNLENKLNNLKNSINQQKEKSEILKEIFSIIITINPNNPELYFLLYQRLKEIKIEFKNFLGDSLKLTGCPLCDVYSIYIGNGTQVTFEFMEGESLLPGFRELKKCPRCNKDLLYF